MSVPADAPPAPDVAAPGEGPPPTVWGAVREALLGSHRDYTQGSLRLALFVLSVPMVLEMVLESVFAVVDMYVVSRLGKEAVATVVLTESLLVLLYAVAMGLAIGATALVARRAGAKDADGAARGAVQAIALGVALSAVVGVGGVFAARPLLALMGASPWVLEHGVAFTQVMLGGSGSVVMLFIINALFRGAGDGALSMRTLWLANAINIVLAPGLVLGLGPLPELGLVGAAVATTIGRSTGVAFQVLMLVRGTGRLRIRRAHLALEPETLRTILRLSSSAALQTFVGMASWMVLTRIIARFGDAAVAGYGVAMRLVMFALLPSWGLSNPAATLVGQSLGARRPERGEQAGWLGAGVNLVVLGGVGLLYVVAAPSIASAFRVGPEAGAYAVTALRVVSAGFLFYAFGMVMSQAFNGAGDPNTGLYLNLACFWALELPLAWALSGPLGLGPLGAFVSVPVAFSVLAAAAVLLFRRGAWKRRAV